MRSLSLNTKFPLKYLTLIYVTSHFHEKGSAFISNNHIMNAVPCMLQRNERRNGKWKWKVRKYLYIQPLIGMNTTPQRDSLASFKVFLNNVHANTRLM